MICRHCSEALEVGRGYLAHLGRRQPALWECEKETIGLLKMTACSSAGILLLQFSHPLLGNETENRMGTSKPLSLTSVISWKWDPKALLCFSESQRLVKSALYCPKRGRTMATLPWESKLFQFDTRVNIFNKCNL